MRVRASLALFAAAFLSGEASAQYLERANASGAAGETDSLWLTPPGYFVNPYYNDVSGGTDKLLTASMKVGRLWQWTESSYELILRWRFLTPAYQHAFAESRDDDPPGTYADWAEFSHTYAQILPLASHSLKVQGTVGFNHVGNKGAKKVHYWIHEQTKNQVQDLEYTGQPEGRFLNVGALAAFVIETKPFASASWQFAPGIGVDSSRFMTEAFGNLAAVAAVRPHVWELAAELKAIVQERSGVYDSIRPFRYEASFGTLFRDRYKPTIKYVSAYLNGDRIGQTYFDFLNVQIPL